MLGKSPRKSGKATATGIGGKNILKIKQQSQKKYSKAQKLKIPKDSKKFSLASDSSLSSVSDDDNDFHNLPNFNSSSDEEERNVEMNAIMGTSSSESESESDDDDLSSEDDSDVDFVLLTKDTKARAMKAAKSRKAPRKSNKGKKSLEVISKKELEDEKVKEVDFQFEFDNNGNETFKIGEKESSSSSSDEEDIGEEIPDSEFKLMNNNYDSNVLQDNNLLKNHLMMDVPKIKEDELNSDEDYEIDDDQLIQTLQNDNDDLELAMDDDDDENSDLLEELLDANEFDNLTFEGEEDIDDYDELIENTIDDEENDNYLLKEETNAITKDFDSFQNIRLNHIDDEDDDGFLKYLSEDSVLFDDDAEEDNKKLSSDLDEDEYELTFFSNPFKELDMNKRRATRTSKRKFSVNDDPRGEFHWPYMKKMDNDYNEDDEESSEYSSDEEDDIEEESDEDDEIHLKLITEAQMHSGDSTDEDTSLPTKKTGAKLNGAKMLAKEILSTSETAPPMLGKWKTSKNSKPFGIIDGLSTRSFQPEPAVLSLTTGSNGNKRGRSSSFSKIKTDEPMLIDDLLNMSELEDGDEEVNGSDAIGYISTRKIPLSLFRNKGYVPSIMDSMDQLKKYSMNNRRLIGIVDHPDTLKFGGGKINLKFDDNRMVKKTRKKKRDKKLKNLRRQSVVEAAKEGLRTTKSGLFSENTIADVELFLADVDTGDEFSILFKGVI